MRICVLGPLCVLGSEGPISPGGVRARAAVSWLAANANQRVGFDSLASAMWDRPPADAARRLRMLLGTVAIRLPAGVLVVESAARLVVAEGTVDADRFERLIDDGYRYWNTHESQRAAVNISEAMELWRGSPHPDLAATAVGAAEIDRLTGLRADALELHQELILQGPVDFAAVADLQYLASVHPDRPGFRRQLARGLYRTGRQVEALQVLRDAADEFVDDATMRQLATAILRQEDDAALVAAAPLRRPNYSQ